MYVDQSAPKFVQAAQRGQLEKVRMMLEKDPSLLKIEDSKGNSAAGCAILNGHNDIAIFLVEQGYPRNPTSPDQFPLIMYCTSRYTSDSFEMLKYLLETGANPNIRYEPEDWVPLNMAVNNGMKDKVNLLVKYGANLDSKDRFGLTSLELAEQRVANYKDPNFDYPGGELRDPKVRQAGLERWEGMVKLLKELNSTEPAH